MSESTPRLWRLPLRISGSIGLVASLIYLAGVLGQEDTTFLAQALFWFVVMAGAGAVAWLAGQSPEHGRRLAMGAAVAFFIVALFSTVVFSVIFLVAVILAVIGLAWTPRPGEAQTLGD